MAKYGHQMKRNKGKQAAIHQTPGRNHAASKKTTKWGRHQNLMLLKVFKKLMRLSKRQKTAPEDEKQSKKHPAAESQKTWWKRRFSKKPLLLLGCNVGSGALLRKSIVLYAFETSKKFNILYMFTKRKKHLFFRD